MSHLFFKQNISRLLAVLLAVTLVFTCAPAAFAAEGSCGENLSWSFDGSTLTVSGSGPMTDYREGQMAPWYSFRESILQVSLPSGLTRIGDLAFYECSSLSSVTIPGSVTAIGDAAFCLTTAMTMVRFGDGLQTIGRSAFEQSGIQDLRLPGGLTSLGAHAFYCCENLAYVSIPSSVTSFGSGVFSYCTNLVRADIGLAMSDLPRWTFFGCGQLATVNVQGTSVSASALKVPNLPDAEDALVQQPATPAVPQPVTPPAPRPETEPAETVPPVQENSVGSSVTTVDKSDNVTFVNTATGDLENPDRSEIQLDISATVVNPEGWEEVLTQVEIADILTGENGETVNLTVLMQQGNTISGEVLQALSGKDVSLTVQTQSGSRFTLDCTKLPETVKKDLKLTYSLTLLEDVPAGMEGCTVYQLTFDKSSDIQTEMTMRLPGNHSFQTATLYRMDKKEPVQLQHVLVDDSGNAHWYLRSIDHKQTYLIGINIPGADTESPIIPAELAGVYKVANVYDGVEYVVTGRTSSWNMGLGRVMAILAVVMVSAIVVVGFVMYALNKRRLKNGYVPQWLEEDEE